MICPLCCDGWVCEQHPDREWPHDDCGGPGMPCPNGCEPMIAYDAIEIIARV